MLFMVVEHFKEGRAEEIYRRANQRGRMLPSGLDYIDSWISVGLHRCYQLMRCDDESLFQQWLNKWEDLVEFEIVPVITSNEAHKKALADNHDDV